MRPLAGPALILAALLAGLPASAQEAPGIIGANVKRYADGVIGLMGYSAIPDGTVSSVSIDQGSTGNPNLTLYQLGAGMTFSRAFPIYLEGFIAGARYDPSFVFSNGQEQRTLPTRWNSVSGTGGIGWDFFVTENLALRPILNVSLGYILSDLKAAQDIFSFRNDADVDFLDGGDLLAGGLGGSLMLDYELVRPAYEVDVELRYTSMFLTSLGGSTAVKGTSEASALNLWSRLRVPSGVEVFGRPLRLVGEAAHSWFFGDQVAILGAEQMSTLGAGIEFDLSATNDFVSRLRIVGRYSFGEDLTGFAVGLAVSF